MTPIEMLEQAMRPSDIPGLERSKFMTLVIPYRKHRGPRVQVLKGKPSLFGVVVGMRGRLKGEEATLTVSLQCADVITWFTKHLTVLEGAAIEAAERGDDEKSKEMMDQYIAVRDRLATAPGARGNL